MKIGEFNVKASSQCLELQKFTNEELKNANKLTPEINLFFKENYPEDFYSREEKQEHIGKRTSEFYEFLSENKHLFLIRDAINGKIKGLLELEKHNPNQGYTTSQINWIILDKDLQGKTVTGLTEGAELKISDLLLMNAENQAKINAEEDTNPSLSLMVKNTNSRAKAVYLRNGFNSHESGENTFLYKDL